MHAWGLLSVHTQLSMGVFLLRRRLAWGWRNRPVDGQIGTHKCSGVSPLTAGIYFQTGLLSLAGCLV